MSIDAIGGPPPDVQMNLNSNASGGSKPQKSADQTVLDNAVKLELSDTAQALAGRSGEKRNIALLSKIINE